MRDKYLEALNARLWCLPAWKRSEIREELVAHIELLVLQEQHQNPATFDATQVALEQFGDAALVGRLLAWQWHKENLLMNKKKITVAALLLFPAFAVALLAIALQKPALVARKIEVASLSSNERRDYFGFKGADTKVMVEVMPSPSLLPRPFARDTFARDTFEVAGLNGSYLMDAAGRKYQWNPGTIFFARRGKNILVTYPISLDRVPLSAGKVTFISCFAKGKEWKTLPISVVVRR